MARLIVPKVAYRFTKGKGKYHLENPRIDGKTTISTVCGKLVFLKDSGCPDEYEGEKMAISDLHPDSICCKCLGAMVASKD